MGFIGRLKFNRRFFAGLLVVLVFFGVVYNIAQVEASKISDNGETFDEFSPGATIGLGDPNDTAVHTTNNVEIARQNNGHVNFQPLNPEKITLGVWLVRKASDLVMWTVSSDLYDDVFFSEGARRSLSFIWGVVRDFVNMFYLLVLIFLAITTILRVNKFSDKKLFFNVLVSAILVNFSLPITLVVIDFSNMLMDFFSQAIISTLHGKDIGTFLLKYSHYSTSITLTDLIKSGVASMVQFMIEIAMAVMLFFTAISLLVRLVAYWVLIILSPLAFFSIALPGSGSFQEWKDKLLNYSFYGPIMLFFIWIALLLLAELSAVLATANQATKWTSGETGKWLAFIVPYITVMYLLYYGHDKSKSMAAKAGDTVSMLMTKGGDYAVKAGKNVGTLGMAPLVESHAKAQFTGMKARVNEGKWTRLVTKEGRKEAQEEKDFNAKVRYASSDKKQALEMQRAEKTLSKMKEGGKDIENEDVLVNMLRSGNKAERQAAALQLAKLGKLGIDSTGNRYTEAKRAVAGSKFLDKAVERGAGAKNKVAIYKHHLDNYMSSSPNADSVKFVNDKIDAGMAEANANGASYTLGDDISRKNFIAQRRLNYEKNIGRVATMDEGREQAVLAGMFSEAKSNTDLANMANEQKGVTGINIAEHMATYLKTPTLGANRYSHRGTEVIADNLKGEQRAVFRNRGII